LLKKIELKGEKQNNSPVAPFMLSTQPGKGSLSAAVTIDGRTIANGTLPHLVSSSCSAKPLV
jgi:hypothetical protein